MHFDCTLRMATFGPAMGRLPSTLLHTPSLLTWLQMQAWPAPLVTAGTSGAGEIVAHAGIADLARELYPTLLPYLVADGPEEQLLTFAGAPALYLPCMPVSVFV